MSTSGVPSLKITKETFVADVPDMDEPSSHAGNGMGGTRWTGDAIGRFKSSQLAHSYISTYYPLDSSSFQFSAYIDPYSRHHSLYSYPTHYLPAAHPPQWCGTVNIRIYRVTIESIDTVRMPASLFLFTSP